MSRFQQLIAEKVSKKEIDEVLKSNDVLVGAEFEFKIHESYFEYEMDERRGIIQQSEDYDNDMDEYQREHDEWIENRDAYRDMLEEEEAEKGEGVSKNNSYYIDGKMEQWDDEHPEPYEPEKPYDYLEKYDRDDLDINYEMRERFLRNYMESDSSLSRYTDNDWEFHEDSSLDEGYGIELVSPAMEVKDFLVACERIFKMINEIGFTDNECGLHIGVSLKKGMRDIDITKLILFTDEPYIWKHFEARETNSYVEKMQEHIRKVMYHSGGTYYNPVDSEKRVERISELKKMIRTKDLKLGFGSDHYHGVNIQHMEESNPYIEFRYMGGSGYSKKWGIVRTVIAQYIYNIKLSRDPEFKKKEYIAKCSRILAKFETWTIMRELARLEEAEGDEEFQGKGGENKRFLAMRNLKRRLQFLPKLTTDEKYFMQNAGV